MSLCHLLPLIWFAPLPCLRAGEALSLDMEVHFFLERDLPER